MSLKVPMIFWKIFGIIFTSILAPLGIRHFDNGSCGQVQPESPQYVAAVIAPPEPCSTLARIVARGSGASADAAFQNAIDGALHQAVASEVSAVDWSRHRQMYFASLRHNGKGILRGWQELKCSSERRFIGRIYHSEVAVEVDVETLRERLHPGISLPHP